MFGSVCILHAYAYPRIEVEDESPAHLIKIDILSDPAVTFTLIRIEGHVKHRFTEEPRI